MIKQYLEIIRLEFKLLIDWWWVFLIMLIVILLFIWIIRRNHG